MYSQRFEEKSHKWNEHPSKDGSTKCERVPWMTDLQNESVPETFSVWTAGTNWTLRKILLQKYTTIPKHI